MIRALLIFMMAVCCFAQRVHVYSPLTRVDPSGEIVKADRGSAEPRHILSPGVPRNASTPLRIVVEMDRPEFYLLDIGQNPEDAVKATLYKEVFVETPAGFVPDRLEEVSTPYRGFPADFRLPGQKAVTFWLDMKVAKNAPVDRIKVEPQLYVDSKKDWIVYPMEVRVQEPVVPDGKPVSLTTLPGPEEPADAAVRAPLQAALCGAASAKASVGTPLTSRELLRRYAEQDLRLARDRARLRAAFTKFSGFSDADAWCKKPSTPAAGPEWYLRLRDAVYRESGAK